MQQESVRPQPLLRNYSEDKLGKIRVRKAKKIGLCSDYSKSSYYLVQSKLGSSSQNFEIFVFKQILYDSMRDYLSDF